MTLTPFVLLVLALLGITDTIWLSQAHLFGGTCGAGAGCDAVLASQYTRFLGVPLASLGLGFYLTLAGLAWRALVPESRDESVRWISLLSLLGFVPALLLIFLQGFVIGPWCPFCLLSAALMSSALAVSMFHRIRRGQLRPLVGALPGAHVAVPAVVGLCAPSVLLVGLEHSLPEAMPTTATPTHIAARVGDREITLEEMDRAIGLRLSETRSSLREEWLDLQVLEAEALKKGLDVRQLLRQEISVDPISQQDIDRFYEMNRERMPADVPRARLDPQIRDQLRRDAGQQAQVEYIGQLRLRYGAALVRPPVERFAIDANPRGGPERGPADAPITIVAFSDLECSYCAHSHRQLEELQRERPDDLRLVFRHYPLRMHANARLAAEVAACAHQQDRFWPLVEVLFENQTRLEIDRVRGHAMALGLDMLQLDGCLQSGVGAGIVNADVAEADELGVSSTPAFFINGHFVKQLPTAAGLEAWIQR